ncbi:MAG: hydantoinase B/oxoprolinase family protein [Alphaproteobacteria bacterium]|nr:hydantoinase B/oxoprolinase family protein [Alphaproteobacteria bacterium]
MARRKRDRTSAPDPVTVSVLASRLSSIVEEMGEAMIRTSYSQILNSSRDFSMAMTDAAGQLVAQADHIPVHVGAMPWAAKAVIARFGADIAPGDAFLLNDPYHGGSHLPDLTAIQPVFDGARLAFWLLARAHQSDIGGATHGGYNAAATEIWQEGLRVPPLRVQRRGVVQDDIFDMLVANVRHPRDFRGDLAAMMGAVRLGARRLEATLAEFGGATVARAADAILDAAEQRARAIIRTWRDGTWRGTAVLDDDGQGRSDIAIRARVVKKGDRLTVDLSESDPQSTGIINSSYANMRSGVAMAIAYLMDPDVPRNDGMLRPVEVIAREGTVVWAREGAPVALSTSHCAQEIVEAIVVALAPACPDRAMAGWARRFRIAIKGEDPRTRRPFIWHLFHARPGAGASAGGDGWPNAGEWHSAGGIKFGSVEVAEVRFPLHFAHHEFRPRSGGAGRHRGGDGVDLELVPRIDTPAVANTAGDGARHGARGVLGGADGKPHRYELLKRDGSVRVLRTKEAGVRVDPGDRFAIHSAGGGGWGRPAKTGTRRKPRTGR